MRSGWSKEKGRADIYVESLCLARVKTYNLPRHMVGLKMKRT